MFRPVLIAAVLAGMGVCEYRCLLGGASDAGMPHDGAGRRTCGHAGHGGCDAAPDERPGPRRTAPCCPGHEEGDDECGCQGVCGGAVSSPAYDLTSLLGASGPSVPTPSAVAERDPVSAHRPCEASDPGGAGPPSGRARRIRFASLLT